MILVCEEFYFYISRVMFLISHTLEHTVLSIKHAKIEHLKKKEKIHKM